MGSLDDDNGPVFELVDDYDATGDENQPDESDANEPEPDADEDDAHPMDGA